ncbi:hypothetical protein WR25_12548 isoform B [Diploscapter pachys]|uniref:Peptidase C1A papain C-terminal domain-containing protein n=1 Tax=Diploscapter pachys TaxID=2018661 RepID=A0A2A2JRD8_9BILA|nr:hypothetical protein WR25_12548 isoform B [Diploscapter pachys]
MSSDIVAEVANDQVILVEADPKPPHISSNTSTIVRNTVVRAKKDKKPKHKRTPWTYFQVLALGIILLFLILACVIIETISRLKFSEATWTEHTKDQKKHHIKIVDSVNAKNLGWTASYNRFASLASDEIFSSQHSMSDHNTLFLPRKSAKNELEDTEEHINYLLKKDVSIPESFDARLKWPLCWSIHQIFNQAGCGSCWSVSSAAVMSDRICIASNGTIQKQISVNDLTSCCTNCGGCEGTEWALSAFSYWKSTGIVSGGSFGSGEGCRPYTKPPTCGGPCSSKYYDKKETPSCTRTCQPLYGVKYEDDLSKASKVYWLRANSLLIQQVYTDVTSRINQLLQNKTVEIIQKDVLLHGPVLACFSIYEDLQHYKSGVYNILKTYLVNELYGHCVRLLGWGIDPQSQKKYWLMANSWGRDFGENGELITLIK